tara:strand:- start:54728 stop:55456 length:729 start_codon:yes stop_codon:yes gene_type:complete
MDENLLNQTPNIIQTQPDDTPLSVPDKFIDQQSGEIRIDALVKSYLELEKKLSSAGPSLADADGRARVLKELGCPDCASDYSVDLSHGLFDLDEELNQKLFDKGFTNDQVQMVYDAAASKLVPMILDLTSEFQADREMERLVSEFGGVEKWQEVSRQLLAYGQKNLAPDVLSGLAGSYDGVMALYRMMSSDQPALNTMAQGDEGMGADTLKSMMADPKYWKTKDPEHIAKVTSGFKNMYRDA